MTDQQMRSQLEGLVEAWKVEWAKDHQGTAARASATTLLSCAKALEAILSASSDEQKRLDHLLLGDPQHPQTRDYVATNLLAHIDKMPNTGDWHGQLEQWAKANSTGQLTANPSPDDALDAVDDYAEGGDVLPPPDAVCRCWNEGEWGRVHREDCPIHGT